MGRSSSSSSSISTTKHSPNLDNKAQERLQIVETLKTPVIQLGESLGYIMTGNYDLGAGPIDITWTIKPALNHYPPYGLASKTKRTLETMH